MHRIYQIRLCNSTHKTCTLYPTKPKSDQWQFRTFNKSPRHSARLINTVTKFHNFLRCSLCCFSLSSQAISDWQFPEKIAFSGKVLSRKIFNFLRIRILISVWLWFWPFFFFSFFFFCVFFCWMARKKVGKFAKLEKFGNGSSDTFLGSALRDWSSSEYSISYSPGIGGFVCVWSLRKLKEKKMPNLNLKFPLKVKILNVSFLYEWIPVLNLICLTFDFLWH